jgi:2-polyprenyl-3-methyl-5-hydroxy-6-metoxy-1,4-benzoquinol methylase
MKSLPTSDAPLRAYLAGEVARKKVGDRARAYLLHESIPLTLQAFRRITSHLGQDPQSADRLRTGDIRMVDLGAGHNLLARLFEEFLGVRAIGADFILVDSHRMVVSDFLQATPFTSQAFDVVASLAVFEHVWKPRLFLEETYRIVRPGGLMYLSTPNFARANSRIKQLVSATIRPSWPNAASDFVGSRQFTGHVREYTLHELCQVIATSSPSAVIVEAGYHQVAGFGRRTSWAGRLADAALAPARLVPSLRDCCHVLWRKPRNSE